MKKALGIIAGVLVFILLALGIGGGVIWSHRNVAVGLEERIEAQYVANQSSYDNMWKKFKEMTQVTDLQAEQYKEVYTGLIQGRYQDPNVLFKMVKEDNPKLDGAVYTELQREISAGRSSFNNDQKAIADIVREYNTYVRKNIVMSFVTGRQPKDPNNYVITSDTTQEAFKTKKADVIDLKK